MKPKRKILDWLERFEELAELNKWKGNRLTCVKSYFYNVLCLCRQVVKETGTEMSEIDIVEHLLNGISSMLLEELWPLVPEPIDSTQSLLAAAIEHAPAKEMMGSLQPKI